MEADLEFIPEPPSSLDEAADRAVKSIESFLGQAARRTNVATALYHALSTVLSCSLGRIGSEKCERLLDAANGAFAAAEVEFSLDYDALWDGMEGVAGLIIYAAEDDAHRAFREPHLLTWRRRVLILRNLLHNIDLANSIADDAAKAEAARLEKIDAEDALRAPFFGDRLAR